MHPGLQPDSRFAHVAEENRLRIVKSLLDYLPELRSLEQPTAPPFSPARLMLAMAENRAITGRELEVVSAAAMALRQQFYGTSCWLPFATLETRAMGTTPGGKGGYAVAPNVLEAASVLAPTSTVAAAGVNIIDNLREGVLIPRATSAPSISWIGGNTAGPAENPPALGNVSANEKTGVAFVRVSLQLLRQGVAVDPFLRALLSQKASEALDTAVLAGAGDLEPLGLLNTAGIGTQAGAALSHAGLLAMRKAVLNAGARESSLAWVGTPTVQEALGARERATDCGRFLWDADGVLGRPAFATKTAPTGALVVGDFSQAVACIFGPGIQIDVDPSQNFNTAEVVFRVKLMCDVAFPQPAAFSVATSVT